MIEKEKKVFDKAMRGFNASHESSIEVRKIAAEDRRFLSIPGAMYEGAFGEQFKNKPMFEFNKIKVAANRLVNDYMQNRISPIFSAKEGKEYDKLADVCASLYRADEQDSCSDEALDNAFKEGPAGGGMGAWRLTTREVDEDNEEDERQRIVFEPIYDACKTVYFNTDAKRTEKSDATECWVLTSMSRDYYEDKYDESIDSWPEDVQSEFDWAGPDAVWVAEYYKKEKVKEVYKVYRGLINGVDGIDDEVRYTEEELEDDPELEQNLIDQGYKLVREEKKTCNKVHKYIMSGGGILEDLGFIAGEHIPIIVTYGDRWYIDGNEWFSGIVRNAKDQARLDNMLRSRLAMDSASSGVEKPVVTPEQIAGREDMWSNDNINNNAVLLLNQQYDADGNLIPLALQYTRVSNISPALAALLQVTDQDRKDILGDQLSSEQTSSNVSGRSVELTQQALDSRSYLPIANHGKAIRWCAKVWLSMAKEVYVEEKRKMKAVTESGDTSYIELNRPALNDDGVENDLSKADFDIAVDVGPSSSSKRTASVRELMGLKAIESDPQNAAVIGLFILMNMEGEGLSDLNDYARKRLVEQGIVEPTEDEKKELEAAQANQQPDPQAEYLKAAAQNESAKAVKAQADTMLTAAKVEETRIKVAEMLAGIDASKQQQVLDLIQTLQGLSQEGQSTAPNQAGESKGVSDE